MVEKKVIIPDEEYLRRGAVEKIEVSPELRFSHTRECHELNEALNCKQTTEKKCTEEESIAYGQILEENKYKKRRYKPRIKNENSQNSNI